jgi:hypothetical protein
MQGEKGIRTRTRIRAKVMKVLKHLLPNFTEDLGNMVRDAYCRSRSHDFFHTGSRGQKALVPGSATGNLETMK